MWGEQALPEVIELKQIAKEEEEERERLRLEKEKREADEAMDFELPKAWQGKIKKEKSGGKGIARWCKRRYDVLEEIWRSRFLGEIIGPGEASEFQRGLQRGVEDEVNCVELDFSLLSEKPFKARSKLTWVESVR